VGVPHRGGHRRHHEAALFFLISGVGVVVNSAPLYASRYLFGLAVPRVSLVAQEAADFVSGIVVGTPVAMVFRFFAFRRWVFPRSDVRTAGVAPTPGDGR
jgi:putative flippase GtrA